ncbi:hypothetical protein RB595_010756 [Gaeumannomyces hyphopodioides]
MPASYLNSTPLRSQHESEDLDWDVTPLQARKRRLGATTGTDPQPLKRTRLTGAHKTTLCHLEPKAPGRSASFLRDFSQLRRDYQASVPEWLGSLPEARCRSGSHSAALTQEPTRSVSEMGKRWNLDVGAGSVATLDPTGTFTTSGPSYRSLVEDPRYRDNLEENNIFLRYPCDPIPASMTSVIDRVHRSRDSTGPSLDEIRQDRDLQELAMGAPEPEVEEYFRTHVFPAADSSDKLQRNCRLPMAKHTVPISGSEHKISTPMPDILYGYNRRGAFTRQEARLISTRTRMDANSRGLAFPFFVVEFKGDGDRLSVATNQCLGASASCVNIAERFSRQLNNCDSGEIQPIDTAAFSVAMNGTVAKLYISWKQDELSYYMANFRNFALQDAEQYREFRKIVRNIVDWGKTERLKQIRDLVDSLLEEGEQQASRAAKPRPSLSGDSAANSYGSISSSPSGGSAASNHGSTSPSRSDGYAASNHGFMSSLPFNGPAASSHGSTSPSPSNGYAASSHGSTSSRRGPAQPPYSDPEERATTRARMMRGRQDNLGHGRGHFQRSGCHTNMDLGAHDLSRMHVGPRKGWNDQTIEEYQPTLFAGVGG